MNFPQFWAYGKAGSFSAWRWSANSVAEAQDLAMKAAMALADRFRNGIEMHSHGGRYYPNHPLREQMLQEFRDLSGQLTAVVTRNSYGCQVLNTAQVMFVDIDLPEPRPPRRGFLASLFGKAPTAPPPASDPSAALAKVEAWTKANPGWGWRVYRTRAGLRLLAVQAPVAPESDAAKQVFEALGADPLYRILCQTQKCYRARLTPKPWRCGVFAKPRRWPWLTERDKTRFEKWEAQYRSFSGAWATCEFLQHIGNATVHPEVAKVIAFHDEATRVHSNLKLA